MNVALGQEVEVKVEGMQQPLLGKVARINPATQSGSRSIMVYVQIANPQNLLRVGMFGEVRLTLAKKAGVLTIPQSALQGTDGSNYVYAIEDGKVARKPVALGIRGDDGSGPAVEVLSGLQSGAQIVRTNLGSLRTGSVVKLTQAGGTSAPKQ
jgi:membrane fusion protein (multidrug efflux system)